MNDCQKCGNECAQRLCPTREEIYGIVNIQPQHITEKCDVCGENVILNQHEQALVEEYINVSDLCPHCEHKASLATEQRELQEGIEQSNSLSSNPIV